MTKKPFQSRLRFSKEYFWQKFSFHYRFYFKQFLGMKASLSRILGMGFFFRLACHFKILGMDSLSVRNLTEIYLGHPVCINHLTSLLWFSAVRRSSFQTPVCVRAKCENLGRSQRAR